MRFDEAVRALGQQGATQAEVAEEIGISLSALTAALAGKRPVPRGWVPAVARLAERHSARLSRLAIELRGET